MRKEKLIIVKFQVHFMLLEVSVDRELFFTNFIVKSTIIIMIILTFCW